MGIMQSILPVHVLIQLSPSMESFLALFVMITTVKLVAEMKPNNITTVMILSGMVRGVRDVLLEQIKLSVK